ncbi:ribokinase [Sphaerotilus sp.]|uniref:ribokinase n=1 Tax=Sphaerotilus sp. TaxID=2093942 RepID=UPI00286E4501|nr:ribokinase [Sphaerotilus sp.]
MPASPTVAVIGSLNMDLRVQTPRLPVPGETLIGTGFSTDSGGKGANQAVAAARMGAAVAMLGRVGRDAHGAALAQALRTDDIDTTGVGEDTEAPTGTAVIVLMPDGENSIIVIPGANHRYTPAHVTDSAEVLRNAKVAVAQLECPLDTVRAALTLAHGAGVCTVLNAAPAQPLDDALLAAVDWLVVNEIEAAMLTGLPTDTPVQIEAAAHALRRRGPSQVVVTLGAAGLLHIGPDGVLALPAPRVTAVDTTGAGDTFVGALAAGLADGLQITAALTRAQVAAALAVTRLGTQSAMPTRAEVEVFAPAS